MTSNCIIAYHLLGKASKIIGAIGWLQIEGTVGTIEQRKWQNESRARATIDLIGNN